MTNGFDLYTPKTVRKIRDAWEPKKNFLTDLFFKNSDTVPTEEIVLEITKGGEHVAPFVTPLEMGRPVVDRTTTTNLILAPNIAVSRTLGPKDYFVREAGMNFFGEYDPATRVGKRIAEILTNQERYISNKEELMVSQFLTTGKVTSTTDEASYEVDYGIDNMVTLQTEEKWGKTGVNPITSLDNILAKAEENGVIVKNVVMGLSAADKFMNSSEFKKEMLSKDLQTEFVKEVIRQYPGVVWLGTYKTYGVELFRYSRKIIGYDGTEIQLMPTNMILGGSTEGKILYAPVINMGTSDVHMVKRFSDVDSPNKKTKIISTESRPVLQPDDLSGYFNVIVCDAE
ncbi:minor capsid protein E [Fusobacterium ulcerans]|uniref:Phage major capsid protein E n=1 Tax=Fusobacterium ulcerans TaxID=861 RepID=A0AAX2JDT8_9FUSO|nr:major capsid protein [Fusobacterium ulcerans]AVQ29476.1 minor capsid protein E [Fusobacterium ulcerans]EFS27025.2 hypothetical protein FUAG_02540 [Fusobacterium ulcerans ATCC 49185]SQJ03957.1 Phage major capsid protein E [Fusobacterium ulcerans]